uniref:Cyclin-A2 n=1 Tax=Callorhinchus milii TaxID=7868 RepID=A0A4W3HCH2_CALMI|eukprot:gi/632966642/ref/XP_007899531.1/ PREDICTED: cyclin-A2-like [Callorhinchus milii]
MARFQQEKITTSPPGGKINQKRAVLGELSNLQSRVQPFRAAKQVTSANRGSCFSEGGLGGIPATTKDVHLPPKDRFIVYQDLASDCQQNEPASKSRSTLPSDANSQPVQSRKESLDTSIGSPMVLDTSLDCVAEVKLSSVLSVSEYANDIFKHLRKAEVKCMPKATYLSKQPDITNGMRAILVDWLVEVGEEYKLHNETLHLAVNYVDRFLSSMSVQRGKLQLVGTAAMFLASKFEEIYPPEVGEFVYITDDTYTINQVLKMETLVLKVLSFDLAAPTIIQFLMHYFRQQQLNSRIESLALYLGELTLINADAFLKYLPSMIAAAAFCLANYTITGFCWTTVLENFSGYSSKDIHSCLTDLHREYLKIAEHPQQAVREKYRGSKYHAVAKIDPPLFLLE